MRVFTQQHPYTAYNRTVGKYGYVGDTVCKKDHAFNQSGKGNGNFYEGNIFFRLFNFSLSIINLGVLKKKIFTSIIFILILYPGYSQIWTNQITTGRPIGEYYLGDKIPANTYFQFEIGQASWDASDVGIGQNPDGNTGWSWATALWYENGSGSNKRVQRDLAGIQMTATGAWYAVGRARISSVDPWTYADESGWSNNTDLNASTSSGNCPYFTVNALGDPTSCTASISGTTATLGWTKFTGGSNTYNVMIVRYPKNATPTAPTNTTAYALNDPIGSGTVVYATNNGSGTTNSVTASTDYDYYFYSENWTYYSAGVKVTALAPPSLTGISSSPGSSTQTYKGSTVTVSGINFDNVTEVKLGGPGGTPVTIVSQSSTEITFIVPDVTSSGTVYVSDGTNSATSIESLANLGYITAASSDWNLTTTWLGGSVPEPNSIVTIAHDVHANVNATVASITINSGKTFTIDGGGVIFQSNGGIHNHGALQVDGILQMNGGSYIDITAPVYSSGSTLRYASNGNYDRTLEWGPTCSPFPCYGYPYHVELTNNTTLVPGGSSNTNIPLNLAGNLTIDQNSKLYMDFGTVDMSVPLIVGGNITLSGDLSLSDIPGGDIKVGGNWTRTSTGNFYPKSRAVFFDGSSPQTISAPAGGETFDYLIVSKPSENLTLNSPVTINQKLTLTKGVLITTPPNLLSVLNTSTGAVIMDGVPGESFISGPVQWTLLNNINADGTSYLFPVGDEAFNYRPFELLNIRTGPTSPVIRVTVASSGAATPSAPTASMLPRNWCTEVISGNFTSTTVRITENSLSFKNVIGNSAAQAGAYTNQGGNSIGATITSNTGITLPNYFALGILDCSVEVQSSGGTPDFCYPNLKAAFDAIIAGTHTGVITVLINNSTTESATAVLNASGSGPASYSDIKVYPTAANLSVTGNIPGNPLIKLDGADKVTIDGRVNQSGATDLVLSNSSNSAADGTSTIQLINGATNNTIQYCNILGSSTAAVSAAAGTILFSTGTSGNNGNSVTSNNIGDAVSGLPSMAVTSYGSAGATNDNNTISGNNIYNWYLASGANAVNILANSSAWTINGNKFYQTAPRSGLNTTSFLKCIAIASASGSGYTINNNVIGYSSAGGTGMFTNSGGRFAGIDVTVAASPATNIQGNTINNINWTTDFLSVGGAAINGIIANLGGFLIGGPGAGNTIGAASGVGSSGSGIYLQSTVARAGIVPIHLNSNTNCSIIHNAIGAIATNSAASNGNIFFGIWVEGTGNYTIQSNTIGGTTAGSISIGISGTTTADTYLIGIYSTAAGSVQTIGGASGTGNTIQNTGSYGSDPNSYMYGIYNGGTPATLNASYNTFTGNTLAGGGSVSSSLYYAALVNLGSVSTLNINHNTGNSGSVSKNGFAAQAAFIYNSATVTTPTININNNTFSGFSFTNAAATAGFYAICHTGAPTGGTATMDGNNISNINLSGSAIFQGIVHAATTSQQAVIANNTITNVTGGSGQLDGIQVDRGAAGSSVAGNTVSGFTGSANINGLKLGVNGTSNSLTVAQNNVSNLASTGSGASTVTGIAFYGSANTNLAERNFIYSLNNSSANTSAVINGIRANNGNVTYQNNIIGLNPATAGASVYGINDVAGTNKIYFNSVALTGTSSAALRDAALQSSNPAATDIRNNIFYNNRGGAGTHYSFNVTGGAIPDYNDYFAASSSGTGGSHSVTANPGFANDAGTTANDYKPAASLAGTTIASVPKDYILANRAAIPTMGALENDKIVTTLLSSGNVCAGSTMEVSFFSSGTFGSGNVYTIQLSDASGNFTSATTLATITSNASGSFPSNSVTIPAGTTTGTGYKIRVVSNDPVLTNDLGLALSVDAIPVAPTTAAVDRNNFCTDDAGNIVLSYIGGSGTTLTWYAGGCGSGSAIGTGQNLSIASPTVTTTYYARWESGTCTPSACASVTVNVIPLPVAPTSATVNRNNFCTDDAGNIILSYTGGSGTILTWYADGCGSGSAIGTGQNLTIASPTVTTTYYARWESGPCSPSACASITVTVDPLPAISLTSAAGTNAQSVCLNTAITSITYAIGGSATGASATGLPPGVNGVYNAGVFTISGSPSSSAGSPYSYTVTTSGGACTAVLATGTITVKPLPVVTAPSSICVTYTGNVTPASGGTWVSNAPAVASVFVNGVITGISAGPATFTFTETASGCSNTTPTVNVYSLPSTPTSVSASPSTINYNAQSVALSATVGGSDVLEWFTGNCGGTLVGTGNITVTPAATTTYYARARNSTTGCVSPCAMVTVTVLPACPADISVCPAAAAFPLNTAAPAGGSYLGDGVTGNTTIGYTFTPAVAGVGPHTITYSLSSSLLAYWNFNAGTIGTPWPDAAIPADVGSGNITRGNWTFGDIAYSDHFSGSTLNAISVPAGNSLSLIRGPVASSMNGHFIKVELSMTNYSNLNISYWSEKSSGAGFTTGQWAWSTDNSVFANFGSAITLTNPGSLVSVSVPANVNGAANVYLRYTLSGATAVAGNVRIDNLQLNASPLGAATCNFTITVYAYPAISGTLSVCEGSTTQLTGSGTPASSNPWSSSNTIVATVNPTTGLVTGIAPGTSTITYTDINGCSTTATITVYAKPTITLGTVPSACPGSLSANLPYTATTGSPDQYSIVWNAAALAAGFINVTNNALPASPIVLAIPAGAAVNTYNGTLAVRNSITSCVGGSSYPIAVTVGDNQAPIAICKDITVYIGSGGTATVTGAMVNNGSTDNCSIASLTATPNTFTCADVAATPGFSDLIISEYVEGNSNNKYIEIYNGTASAINLTDYQLRLYANGASTPTATDALSGSIPAGATIVYRNSSAPVVAGSISLPSISFNGNDAIALYKLSTDSFVDIFGRIGNDPGTAWTGAGGYTTLDKTLRRKPSVTVGVTANPTGTGPTAFTTLTTEWDMFVIDNVLGLGAHSVTGIGKPVTLTVTDGSGNTATCSANVIVLDNTAPTIACKNTTVSLDATGNATITAADITSTLSDNCGIASTTVTPNTFSCANLITPVPADLFISEYVEGSGFNKYIEIYNGTGSAKDLSNYQLRLYTNGAPIGSPSQNITLNGTLPNNSTIVYKHASATIYTGPATTNAAVNFNGNDAVALWKISPSGPVDIFGRIGDDPGIAWTGAGGYTTQDRTLRRNPTVAAGVTVNPGGTGPTAFITLTTEWGLYAKDNVTGLGAHGISAGNITPVTLTVTDATGNISSCTSTVTIQDVTPPVFTFCPASPVVVCTAGTHTGTSALNATATDNCTTISSLTVTLTGATTLASGLTLVGQVFNQGTTNVTWTAVDAKGNSSTCKFDVIVGIPSFTTTKADVSCFGLSNGSITVTASGGNGPYQFSKDNGATYSGGTSPFTFAGLTAGTYALVVKDANNCTASGSVIVSQPAAALATSETHVNVLCFGNATGSIDLTVTGGTTLYSYAWTASAGGVVPVGQAGNQDLTGLVAGTYSVVVTDANLCTSNRSIIITQPAAALATSETHVNVLCFGNTTGSIDLTVTGGTTLYSYAWTASAGGVVPLGQAGNQDLTGLVAGTYSVVVTDANLCTSNRSIIITQPSAALAPSETHVNVLCFGNTTGSIDLTVTGGTTLYTYAWTASAGGVVPVGQAGNQDLTGLVAGTYSVVVTDANLCTTNRSITITQPSAVSASITSQTNVLCYGDLTGNVIVAGAGGVGPYTYALGMGSYQPSGSFSGLAAGPYVVHVKDANGCIFDQSVTITQPLLPLTASITQTNVLCNGQNTGSITVDAAGGENPYTYALDAGAYQNPKTFNNLAAGTYMVHVKDKNGCIYNVSVTITQSNPILPVAGSNSPVCAGSTLNLTGNASGGSGSYTYNWTGPNSWSATNVKNPSITNVTTAAAGTYILTVTDSYGCSASVNTPQVYIIPIPNVTIDPPLQTGFVKKATGEKVFYTFTITNTGQVADIYDLSYYQVPDPGFYDMDVRFLSGGLQIFNTPSIPAGGTFTFQVELTVQGNAAKVLNHTQITATSRLCSNSKATADIYTYEFNGNKPPDPNNSDVAITKEASVTTATEGTPFTYTLTIVNNSTTTSALNVSVSDQVPASLTITNTGGGTASGNTITWFIGTLTKIGGGVNTVQKTITVVPSCSSVPSVTNNVSVLSIPVDSDLTNNTFSLITPVTESIPPTAVCQDVTLNLDATGNTTLTTGMVNNGSSDNCGTVSLSLSKTSFTCTNLGVNTVTLTATDASGNTHSCNATVTVKDITAPAFSFCPTAPAAICADEVTGKYTKSGTSWDATATDACGVSSLTYTLSGATLGTGTSLNGVAFNPGLTTVTWTAKDASNNSSSACSFSVTINPWPSPSGVITGNSTVCQGASGIVYTVPAIGNATGYVWTLPALATITSGSNTNSITVNFNAALSGNISVYGTNGCGSGSSSSIPVAVGNLWKGITSVWNDANNWSCGIIPAAITDVIIPSVSSPFVLPVIESTVSADCHNLLIQPGATVTINSDATSSGSLIVSGTSTGGGNVIYDRNLASAYPRWYITSSPVKGATLSQFSAKLNTYGSEYDFATYNELQNDWNYLPLTTEPSTYTLTPGKGYLAKLKPAETSIQYTGKINPDPGPDVSIAVTNTPVDNGWNAVGNPFTSAIGITNLASSAQTFLNLPDNVGIFETGYYAIYLWYQTASYTVGVDQYYDVINNSGYTPLRVYNNTLSGTHYVQAGQGFLINAGGSGGTIKFTKGMQFHQTATTMKSAAASWPGITLLATNRGRTRSTIVGFNDQMTTGLDPSYDAGLLSASGFNLYTRLVSGGNETDFAVQSLPDNMYDTLVVPVGLDLPQAGDVTFKAAGVILPDGVYPILEDRLLQLSVPLKTEFDSLSVSIDEPTWGIGRFYLRFSETSSTVDTRTYAEARRYTAHFDKGKITLFGVPEPGTKVWLYDLNGRKLSNEYRLTSANRNEIPAKLLSNGMYLLRIEGKMSRQTLKIAVIND